MGNRPDEPGALALMAEILCQSATDEQIAHAMTRCTRECRYPVRLPDLLQRIPGQEIPAVEAEMRAAWDVLIKFVNKWCRWDEGYFDGESVHVVSAHVEKGAPELPQHIVDTVRRTGGWAVYLRMEPRDFPFQQKRFFDEYEAWTAVEKVLPDMAKVLQLTGAKTLQLVKPMDPRAVRNPDPMSAVAKRIPEPLTDAQLADHREMLRQQAATCAAKAKRSL